VELIAVSSGRREVHANLQPGLSHHADGALERLSPVACTDATGLPAGQLAGPRRTVGTWCRIRSMYLSLSLTCVYGKHESRLADIKQLVFVTCLQTQSFTRPSIVCQTSTLSVSQSSSPFTVRSI